MTHHGETSSPNLHVGGTALDVAVQSSGAATYGAGGSRKAAATAGTSGLVAFLTARFDEDERYAPEVKTVVGYHFTRPPAASRPWEATATQITVYGMTRALDEVEAKRDILDELEAMLGGDPYQEGMHAGKLLRLLAGAYRSHPDWREDWAA